MKENSELFKELRKNFLNEDFNFNSIFLEKLNDEDNFLLLFFLFDSVSREELFKINAPEYKKNFKLLYQSFFNIKNVDDYDLLLIAFEYFQMLDNELLENELLEKKEFFNKVMLFISELLLRDRSDYKLLILYNLLKKNNTKLLTNIRLHNLDKKVSSDMFNYYLKGNYSLIKNIDYNELALIAQSIVKSNIVNEYISKYDLKLYEEINLNLFTLLSILETLLEIEKSNNNMSNGLYTTYNSDKIDSSNYKCSKKK